MSNEELWQSMYMSAMHLAYLLMRDLEDIFEKAGADEQKPWPPPISVALAPKQLSDIGVLASYLELPYEKDEALLDHFEHWHSSVEHFLKSAGYTEKRLERYLDESSDKPFEKRDPGTRGGPLQINGVTV